MDDIYYEPIKEDDPGEQLLEAIRRIARAEALRQVEQRLSAPREKATPDGVVERKQWCG